MIGVYAFNGRTVFMSVAATSKFTKWVIGKFLRRRVNLVATNL